MLQMHQLWPHRSPTGPHGCLLSGLLHDILGIIGWGHKGQHILYTNTLLCACTILGIANSPVHCWHIPKLLHQLFSHICALPAVGCELG